MSPQEKIAEVFKKIKDKSEISPNSKWVSLEFQCCFKENRNRFLNNKEKKAEKEKTILLKLETDGFIKLHQPEFFMDGCLVSPPMPEMPEDFIREAKEVLVELLPKFNQGFKKYGKYLKSSQKNYWKILNPIWWVWLLWIFVKKHKIISVSTIFSGLIVYYIEHRFGLNK